MKHPRRHFPATAQRPAFIAVGVIRTERSIRALRYGIAWFGGEGLGAIEHTFGINIFDPFGLGASFDPESTEAQLRLGIAVK
ncbi:hypothetical protein BKG85_05100 [Mycobacteroides chelonae]|nr:hypothetical protein BKG85_05100 [Mycobacteroides chelonae]